MAIGAAGGGAAVTGYGASGGATGGVASMGAMLPTLGASVALSVLGSVLNGVADRQAMRAMMDEKKRQLMLWQKKRALDQEAFSSDLDRQMREIGGMRDVQVRGDQESANLTADTQDVLAAISAAGIPGLPNQQDFTAGVLPGLLAESRDRQFNAHGDMEQRNQGGYRLGSKLRQTNFDLESTLNPIREQIAQSRGSGLRFLGQSIGAIGGLGGALAPFLSGPTPAKPFTPSPSERFTPSRFQPAERFN